MVVVGGLLVSPKPAGAPCKGKTITLPPQLFMRKYDGIVRRVINEEAALRVVEAEADEIARDSALMGDLAKLFAGEGQPCTSLFGPVAMRVAGLRIGVVREADVSQHYSVICVY